MGRIRDTITARLSRKSVRAPSFGEPAEIAAIEAAEAALGLKFPDILRELYQEFDGLCFGEPGACELYRDYDTEYLVLPLQILPKARDILRELYGREALGRMVAQYGPQEEELYDDFDKQLNLCVPFGLNELGASFMFLTDLDAWAIEPGRVGKWDHDGGSSDFQCLFLEYLAESCRKRSLR